VREGALAYERRRACGCEFESGPIFLTGSGGSCAGVSATGASVRVPYSAFYAVESDKITALRIYLPMDQLLAQIGGAAEPEVARSSG
jgi:hypothetical protein